MPYTDRFPKEPPRVRRGFDGIGSVFVPYENAIKTVDLGSQNLITTGLITAGNLDVDTLNLNGNVISDSTGTISFDNENLTTTGLITAGNLDVDTLNLNGNAITDSTGTISLDDENLTTTGILACGMIDMLEISEPATPAADTLRLYVEDIQGFSFFKYLDAGGMKREVMRDSLILVKNVRGTTIAANRIVYATGSADNVPTVDAAKADSISTMPAIGVTIESIANNTFGRVMQVGLLENINTAALAEGDVLYVSDATAGVPTTTPPVTPSLTQEIGTVLVSDVSAGAIQIIARGLTGDEYGTAQNSFLIGDGTAGSKTLTFNAVSDASLIWDETSLNIGVASTFGDGGTTDYLAVAANGDVTFAGAAGFYPRFLTQSAEPAVGTGATQIDTSELLVWKDSDDSKVYLCFNDGGTVKKVELT